jgi:uncharacterized membrane protein
MRAGAKAKLVYGLTLAGTLTWLAAIVVAPYLRSRGFRLNALIYGVFAPTCHQLPSRSFHLWGFPMAVCGRCTGIYLGFLAGMLAYPILRRLGREDMPRALTFVILSLPMAVDALGNFFNAWSTGNALRLITGFIWGTILPFYFLAGLNGVFVKKDGESETEQA